MKHMEKLSSSTRVLLEGAGNLWQHRRKDIIYAQGTPANTIFYINEGMVMLSARAKTRHVVVAVLGAGNFFNEVCLLDHSRCTSTASTITPSSILSIEKDEMSRLLRGRNSVSVFLMSRLLLELALL
jgi:CRP-like cAMP-binding protein